MLGFRSGNPELPSLDSKMAALAQPEHGGPETLGESEPRIDLNDRVSEALTSATLQQSSSDKKDGAPGEGCDSSEKRGDDNNDSDINEDSDGDNSRYERQEYWDNRFEKEDQYEWLCNFDHVSQHFEHEFPLGSAAMSRILVLGCGNSPFSAELHDAGYHNIVSCDFSTVVIQKMRHKYGKTHSKLKWEVADVRVLENVFEENSFDIVVDKACLDALVCNEGDPWSPNEETLVNVTSALNSIVHVLKPSGTFISIGFQQPHFRKRYLKREGQNFGWEANVDVKNIPAGLGYFWYSCPFHRQ